MSERHPSRKTHLVLIFLLFLLTPIHFIHLLPHFSTHIVGDVMDAAEYPLREWWTAHALLDLKTNPFKTDYLFYPVGVNLVQHPYPFLDGLLYTVFRPLVPLLIFHNAMTWIILFANALAAYLLLFKLTGLPGLGFIGALAFAHSPVLTSYQGPQNLIEVYLFVFFVFAAYRLFQRLTYGWAIGSGILLGLSIYNYPYYFVAGLIWLGVLCLSRISPLRIEARRPTRVPNSFGKVRIWVWLTFALVLTLVLIPRALWDFFGIGGRLRTVHGVGFIAVIYVLSRMENRIFAQRKRMDNNGSPAGDSSLVLRWLLPLKRVLLPEELKWRRPSAKEIGIVLGLSALVLVTASLVAFPYTQSYLTDVATRSAIKSLPLEFIVYSVDLSSFFAPHNPWLSEIYRKMAWDWINNRPIVATPAFLGYFWMLLLGIGFGFFFKRPDLRVWIGGWTVFLFLCLGPYLKIHGVAYTSFILPGHFIPKLPLLESTRTLSRFLVPLMLMTIVIGCLLLKDVLSRVSRGRQIWLYLVLALLIGFEFGLWPVPTQVVKTNYQVPQVYHALAGEAEGKAGVLLDLSLLTRSGTRSEGRGETRTYYYQTIHHQRLIGGFSSKLNDSVFTFFQNLPGVNSFWSMNPVSPEELAAALAALDVDWIVLNKTRLTTDQLNAYLSTFRQSPYLKFFYEDRGYLGLRVDQQDRTLKEKAWAYRNHPGI